MSYAICDNKDAVQPAHQCSLISTFVVHCMGSIIPLLAIAEISYRLSRPVRVLTGHKPQRQVFSLRGSFKLDSVVSQLPFVIQTFIMSTAEKSNEGPRSDP